MRSDTLGSLSVAVSVVVFVIVRDTSGVFYDRFYSRDAIAQYVLRPVLVRDSSA